MRRAFGSDKSWRDGAARQHGDYEGLRKALIARGFVLSALLLPMLAVPAATAAAGGRKEGAPGKAGQSEEGAADLPSEHTAASAVRARAWLDNGQRGSTRIAQAADDPGAVEQWCLWV